MNKVEKQLKPFCLHLFGDRQNIFPARIFLDTQCLWSLGTTPATGTLRNPVSKGDSQRLLSYFSV